MATREAFYGQSLVEERRRKEIVRNIFAYIVLSIGALTMVIPFFWTISTALKDPEDIYDKLFIPKRFSYIYVDQNGNFVHGSYREGYTEVRAWWANFVKAWISVPFDKYYRNSLLVATVTTLGQLVTCTLAAYAFARLRWVGRDAVFLLYLGTLMIPFTVTMIPVYILFKVLGLVNTLVAVILPALFSAFGTFLLRQFFVSIPYDLEEAAFIDGANRLQILWHVILPLSKGALATLGTFTFLFQWNDFLWPLIVLNSEEIQTIPVGLTAFQTAYGSQWELVMAASLIALIPVIIIYVFNQRFFTESIMLSGFGGR
ncbi:MAG: carbohydrate ABC transporter permease [Spirochaetia bacterium]|nr:carbohydrate ABC transporter permease [Spirochaetota bacterium]MCX8096894.1 carbohydrate ABC transporter permease [Spirochaetota bacterium]MDW8112465.1 carbohydrate ABC transporter permease [Spirochaetia bacterium]